MSVELIKHVFEGDSGGPHLLISAGVHGDEFVPIRAVRELEQLFRKQASETIPLNGKVTLVPIVNQPAFELAHRCGPDGLDLARVCPGNPDGTTTQQAAHDLTQFIRSADYYVDLHSGGKAMSVLPLAGYVMHSNADILEKQRAMARAFGLPFIWGTSANLDGRSLSVARDANVPAIYIEYLGGAEQIEGVDELTQGCLGVMRYLGMIQGKSPLKEQEVIEDPRPGSGHMQVCNPAPMAGILNRDVELGQEVSTGDALGTVTAADNDTATVHAEQTGKVVVVREDMNVNKGDAICVIAERVGES